MKKRELRNLLNRAAAALETFSATDQGDLTAQDVRYLIADLTTAAQRLLVGTYPSAACDPNDPCPDCDPDCPGYGRHRRQP